MGTSKEITKEIKAFGGTKVLIVTDQGVINSGLINPLRTNLEEGGFRSFFLIGLSPNLQHLSSMKVPNS